MDKRISSAIDDLKTETEEEVEDAVSTVFWREEAHLEGAIQEVVDEAYDKGYTEGYDDGHDKGYDEGYDEGYNEIFHFDTNA